MIFRVLIALFSFVFSDYLGGYSGAGFRYSTNARDMSLGNSLMSEYNQGFNSFSNPALLSQIKKMEIGLSYFPMSLDRSIQTFSISRSLSAIGGASLSILNSGVSSIEGKDFSNNSTGEFDSSEGYVMLSFGTKLGKQGADLVEIKKFSFSKLGLGINIKVLFNNIDKYSATGVATDFGMLYNFSDKIILSAVLNNIFGQYTWDGLQSGEASFQKVLPAQNSLAIKYDISSLLKKISISDMMFFTRIDHMKIDNLSLYRLRSGLEFDYSKYAFRLGMIQNRGLGDFDIKFLLGVGFKNKNYKFDYCIDFGKEHEGISNLFSISFIK